MEEAKCTACECSYSASGRTSRASSALPSHRIFGSDRGAWRGISRQRRCFSSSGQTPGLPAATTFTICAWKRSKLCRDVSVWDGMKWTAHQRCCCLCWDPRCWLSSGALPTTAGDARLLALAVFARLRACIEFYGRGVPQLEPGTLAEEVCPNLPKAAPAKLFPGQSAGRIPS